MSGPLVLALVGDRDSGAALAAGFEEEGVPLTLEVADGDPEVLARRAHGIPLHKEVLQWFAECTSEMGLAPLAQ